MNRPYPLDPDHPEDAQPVEDALLLAQPGIAPPDPAALKVRLLTRIRAARNTPALISRLEEGDWQQMLPGVRVKRLPGEHRATLLELAPGARLPIHRHHEDEECVVLRGEAQLGDTIVRPGDYHLARSGSRHGTVRSHTGALLYLRGTPIGHGAEVARDLLTALLPGAGDDPITIRADDQAWLDIATGVQRKRLHRQGSTDSSMIRLAPGSRLPAGWLANTRECLVVEGEAFNGDHTLGHGDYLLPTPADSATELGSDGGAVLFVRRG